jgi:DNA-binding MarR family transcriptional regulator
MNKMNEEEVISIDKIIENLFYIHPLLSKSLTRSIRIKSNLNPGTLYILGLLSRFEMLSMSEIGCKLSMPKPYVTIQVDKLIAENMVERLFDPKDRRIINIKLTLKGIEDFKSLKQEIGRELKQRIQTLPDQKIQMMLESSQLVRDLLSEIMKIPYKETTLCEKEES